MWKTGSPDFANYTSPEIRARKSSGSLLCRNQFLHMHKFEQRLKAAMFQYQQAENLIEASWNSIASSLAALERAQKAIHVSKLALQEAQGVNSKPSPALKAVRHRKKFPGRGH